MSRFDPTDELVEAREIALREHHLARAAADIQPVDRFQPVATHQEDLLLQLAGMDRRSRHRELLGGISGGCVCNPRDSEASQQAPDCRERGLFRVDGCPLAQPAVDA